MKESSPLCNVFTQGLANGPSLSLGGPGTVCGDLKSGGSIDASGVTVTGQQYPNSTPQELPSIDPTSFDPASEPYLQTLSSSSYSTAHAYTGFVRSSAPTLTFASNLTLNNALLYCTGDIEVDGTFWATAP